MPPSFCCWDTAICGSELTSPRSHTGLGVERSQDSAIQPSSGHRAIEASLVPGNGLGGVLTAFSLLQQLKGQQCGRKGDRRMLVSADLRGLWREGIWLWYPVHDGEGDTLELTGWRVGVEASWQAKTVAKGCWLQLSLLQWAGGGGLPPLWSLIPIVL